MLILSASISVFSQTFGSVNGKVLDLKNKEAIPFVNISLFNNADSLHPKSFQTDAYGVFSIKNLPLSIYKIQFSFIGYQTKVISKITLENSKSVINLGDVFLNNDSKMLNEVLIEYKKPIVEIQDDKIVYNVGQSISAEGSVATDILKNVPMVTVDIDGKATIAGKRNTRIFIDGKPSDYSASSIGDLLSILPSDAIESIEVITDPSSKFDADGDGIINIVLKKGIKVGLSGNVSSRVGTQGNHNTGAFLSTKQTKYTFSANAGYNHAVRLYDASSNRSNFFADTTFYNKQSNNSRRRSDGFNTRLGGSYQIDSAQNLKFSFRGGFNNALSISNADNLYLNEQSIEQTLRTQSNKTGGNNFDYVIDADYNLNGKNQTKYTLGTNFSKNSSNSNRDYSRSVFNPDGTPRSNPSLQLNDNKSLGHNLDLNFDYDKGFSFLNTELEAGLKTSFNRSDESQAVQSYDYNLQDYIFNPSLTNAFNFHQDVYAGYASARFRLQKWSLRFGNRVEFTQVSFIQESNPNVKINPYLSLFPSFALNRSLNNKYSIGVNYSRRVSRPRQSDLNPIIDDSDPQNLKYGNPDLIPSYTDQYELNFNVFSKDWSVSPRVSYSSSNKIIERVKTVSSDGSSITTYQNLANSSALNFNVFGNYRPSKNKTFNAGFTLSKINYTSSVNKKYNRNGINIRSNVGINYSFKKNLTFEANLNYIKNTAAQGVSRGSIETQFGFKQNFFKNKMGFRFTAVDPFTQRNTTTILEGPNFYQESYSVRKTRNFLVSLSYRFTKLQKAGSL
jgi:outer membrane receptor protein involved in Fe transport